MPRQSKAIVFISGVLAFILVTVLSPTQLQSVPAKADEPPVGKAQPADNIMQPVTQTTTVASPPITQTIPSAYPACEQAYYLSLGFGDDVAFSKRDRSQADMVGYKCPDGTYHFIYIGLP